MGTDVRLSDFQAGCLSSVHLVVVLVTALPKSNSAWFFELKYNWTWPVNRGPRGVCARWVGSW